jgi:DNA polymerase I-like protein with 3'-5' exonuclease and polymerase domains
MMEPVVKLHMDVCRVLCDIETNGIKVDGDKIN